MRSQRIAVSAAVLALAVTVGGLALTASSAVGQEQSGGQVQLWATPTLRGSGGGTILFTGAIGDYGVTKRLSGTQSEAILRKGTIKVDLAQIRAASNAAKPTVNPANCSVTLTFSGPVQILSGTGAYAGITGSLTLNESVAGVLPKTKSGSCNGNVVVPLGAFASITGSGTVG